MYEMRFNIVNKKINMAYKIVGIKGSLEEFDTNCISMHKSYRSVPDYGESTILSKKIIINSLLCSCMDVQNVLFLGSGRGKCFITLIFSQLHLAIHIIAECRSFHYLVDSFGVL